MQGTPAIFSGAFFIAGARMVKAYVFTWTAGNTLAKNADGKFEIRSKAALSVDKEGKNLGEGWLPFPDHDFEIDEDSTNAKAHALKTDGVYFEDIAIEAHHVFFYHLPERYRAVKDKDGNVEHMEFSGMTYDPTGKNLPPANWEYIGHGTLAEGAADIQKVLDQQGFFVGERPEEGIASPVAIFYQYSITEYEDREDKTFRKTKMVYTTDPLGKNLPAGEWKCLGDVIPTPEQRFRRIIMKGLVEKGFYILEDVTEVVPKWKAKWYMFIDRNKEERSFLKDDKWMMMNFWGWTADPDRKNLPAGNWEFGQSIEANSWSTFKFWDSDEVYKNIQEKGWHTQWIESDDPYGSLRNREQARKDETAKTMGIVPETLPAVIVTDKTALNFADKIWARLKEKK